MPGNDRKNQYLLPFTLQKNIFLFSKLQPADKLLMVDNLKKTT